VVCPVDSVEDILEEVRVARAAELRKEAAVAFSEYRSYSRIQLTAQRGWDQYLPQKAAAEGEVIATGGTRCRSTPSTPIIVIFI
jgi:hypothetical protein